MTATTIRVQMAQRKDTAANWTAANPILLSGEIGYETDTKKFKIGDGTTNWNSLAYLPIPDGSGNLTITGNLEIGSTGSLTFEGSTADGFETTLAVTNPTADRTITLPNQSGNVLVSGNASIVDADIAANAEIAVSKLADGTARQLLQTDAAGTGVEWTSNVDIPGTLDVTGAATFDAAVTVAGDLTVNGTTTTISTQNLLVEDKNIIIGDVASPTDVTADGGGITLKGATDKTINWVDATDAWTSSERFSVPLGTAALPSLTFTGDPNSGIYSPGADQVAISTGGSGRLFVDASGNVGIGAAPGTSFHITRSASDAVVRIDGGSANTSFTDYRIAGSNKAYIGLGGLSGGSNDDLINYNSSAGNWIAYTNSSERLRITSTGTVNIKGAGSAGSTQAVSFNGSAPVDSLVLTSGGLVGIGTSLPSANLDARGTVALSQMLNVDGNAGTPITAGWAATGAGGKLMTLSNTAAGGSIGNGNTLYLANYSNDNGTYARAFNVTTSGADKFWVGSNGAGYFAGSVGIGNTSPAVACDVVGQVRASTGILFGTDTAAANALDDYEEGTFTPTIVGTTSAGTGTYTNQIGRYTKIGNRVTFTIYLNWTAHTGTGNIRVSNLPFTSTSATGSFHAASIYADGIPFTGPWLQAYVGVNSTNIGMGQMTAAGVVSGIPMDSAGDITITGHYEV